MSDLSKALNYMDKVYHRITGMHIWWKCHHETNAVRFCYMMLWLETSENCNLIWKLQKRAIERWPKADKLIARLGYYDFNFPPEWQKYFDGVLEK